MLEPYGENELDPISLAHLWKKACAGKFILNCKLFIVYLRPGVVVVQVSRAHALPISPENTT